MIVLEVNVVITNNNTSVDCFGLVFFFFLDIFVMIKLKVKSFIYFMLCPCILWPLF